MLPAHAATLVQARSHIAALADHARTLEASSAYERALVELDWIHDDDTPALDTTGLTDDLDTLFATAAAAVERLTSYGIDALGVELLLVALADARAMDEP